MESEHPWADLSPEQRLDRRFHIFTNPGIPCIQGNVPLSLLQLGKAEDVTSYCRRLIDDVKGRGGFILDMGARGPTPARKRTSKP